jgi:hypothetical protein
VLVKLSAPIQGLQLRKDAVAIKDPLILIMPLSALHIDLDQLEKKQRHNSRFVAFNIGVVFVFLMHLLTYHNYVDEVHIGPHLSIVARSSCHQHQHEYNQAHMSLRSSCYPNLSSSPESVVLEIEKPHSNVLRAVTETPQRWRPTLQLGDEAQPWHIITHDQGAPRFLQWS